MHSYAGPSEGYKAGLATSVSIRSKCGVCGLFRVGRSTLNTFRPTSYCMSRRAFRQTFHLPDGRNGNPKWARVCPSFKTLGRQALSSPANVPTILIGLATFQNRRIGWNLENCLDSERASLLMRVGDTRNCRRQGSSRTPQSIGILTKVLRTRRQHE